MDLYTKIIAVYPELEITETDDKFGKNGLIKLQDDGDGVQYIASWNYEKAIPKGLKVGK
jgi:hypothetical protein